ATSPRAASAPILYSSEVQSVAINFLCRKCSITCNIYIRIHVLWVCSHPSNFKESHHHANVNRQNLHPSTGVHSPQVLRLVVSDELEVAFLILRVVSVTATCYSSVGLTEYEGGCTHSPRRSRLRHSRASSSSA